MHTTSTTAIAARDFSQLVTDELRDTWTPGKLRHVIAALDGAPVAIVTDQMTGSTLLGATLDSIMPTPGFHGYDLVTASHYNGKTYRTRRFMPGIGPVIVPLDPDNGARGAKWRALDSYREEKRAAIDAARERAQAEALLGDAEPREYGKWSAEPGANGVFVTYEPLGQHFNAPHGKRGSWTISLREIKRDLAERS